MARRRQARAEQSAALPSRRRARLRAWRRHTSGGDLAANLVVLGCLAGAVVLAYAVIH